MTWPAARAELAAAMLEAFHAPAVYLRTGADPLDTLACIAPAIASPTGFGVPLPEYRTRARLPRPGLPEPQPGDRIEQDGTVWIVTEHDPDGSDDQFLSLWVRPA